MQSASASGDIKKRLTNTERVVHVCFLVLLLLKIASNFKNSNDSNSLKTQTQSSLFKMSVGQASLTMIFPEVRKRKETESGLGIPLLVCASVRRCSLQEESNQPFSSNTSLSIFQMLQRFLFS